VAITTTYGFMKRTTTGIEKISDFLSFS